MSTLTVYPDANAFDAYVGVSGVDEDWATIRGRANATTSGGAFTYNYAVYISSSATTDQWDYLFRGLLNFDTSALGSEAVISDAYVYVRTYSIKQDDLGITPDVGIFSSTPSDVTSVSAADYGNTGTTDFATPITYASWGGGETFTLNASGIANINKTAVSSFCIKNSNYDAANVAPSWSSNVSTTMRFYASEYTGTTFDPYINITYTSGGGSDPFAKIDEVAYADIANVDGVSKDNIANIY